MTTYAYIAKRADGSDARGTLDASSPEFAREALRRQGLMVEDVRERTTPLPWSGQKAKTMDISVTEDGAYAPLMDTLRIFAGWLLGWYGVIYALGFLSSTGRLPTLPFVDELFTSSLVLYFTFGTFLFLALSNIHRWLGKGLLLGCVLALVYVGLVAGFVMYG